MGSGSASGMMGAMDASIGGFAPHFMDNDTSDYNQMNQTGINEIML